MTALRDRIARATAALMGLQLLGYGLALVKQVVVARAFGTSAVMDAFLVAMTVVGLAVAWVLGPVRQIVLPMFRHDVVGRGESVAWANLGRLVSNLTVALLALTLAGIVLAPWLARLIAPGFDEATAAQAEGLIRIVMPCVLLLGLAGLLAQAHYATDRVVLPGVAGLVEHGVVVIAFLALAGGGITGLAIATVIGAAAALAVQVPGLVRARGHLAARIDFRDAHTREAARLSGPLLLSTGGQEVARLTDRVFASLLPAGSLSALAYGGRLITVVHELVTGSLQQSTFPHFTRLAAEGDREALSRALFHYVRVVLTLTMPVAVVLIVLADDLVRLVFERGAFDERSVRLTATALALYALALPAQAVANVVGRTFLGLKDTRTPTRLSLGRIGLKIVLALLLVRPLAHAGLALAESVSHVARTVALVAALPPDIAGRERRRLAAACGKSATAALVMAGLLRAGADVAATSAHEGATLAATLLLAASVYAGITFLWQRAECRTLLGALGALSRWRTA